MRERLLRIFLLYVISYLIHESMTEDGCLKIYRDLNEVMHDLSQEIELFCYFGTSLFYSILHCLLPHRRRHLDIMKFDCFKLLNYMVFEYTGCL